MFENPIAPKPNPAGKKYRDPFKGQPTYDEKKRMFMGGDYYGTGYKAKVGKLRSPTVGVNPIPQKAMRKAPESLA